ncbi:unnamed protein product [Coffea canephora]|uniref:Uncharacterized protein n=1 Tax=Coffea canephora TaxID=49390 RepID=A0A068UQ43_COFCA|nr:unnamed protein product [Coffea canephora]
MLGMEDRVLVATGLRLVCREGTRTHRWGHRAFGHHKVVHLIWDMDTRSVGRFLHKCTNLLFWTGDSSEVPGSLANEVFITLQKLLFA